MDLHRVPIASLTPARRNARTHDPRNLDAIAASLDAFGQQKPLVCDPQGHLIAGHGTLEAAQQLGWTHLDVVYSTLTPEQAHAYAIADNRTSELSAWDDEALLAALLEIEQAGDLASVGFTQAELDDLAADQRIHDTLTTQQTALLDQAIQLVPAREYVVIMCDRDNSEWPALQEAFGLTPVRRGGYKPGSVFDDVGTQRVIYARDLLALLKGTTPCT